LSWWPGSLASYRRARLSNDYVPIKQRCELLSAGRAQAHCCAGIPGQSRYYERPLPPSPLEPKVSIAQTNDSHKGGASRLNRPTGAFAPARELLDSGKQWGLYCLGGLQRSVRAPSAGVRSSYCRPEAPFRLGPLHPCHARLHGPSRSYRPTSAPSGGAGNRVLCVLQRCSHPHLWEREPRE
jgi:hypothetical protein